MTTIANTQRLTAEEFWDWCCRPENQHRRCELDRGEVVEMPSPGEMHGILCGWIAHLLWQYAFQRGAGAVSTNDTGLLVERDPDSVRGPDIMYFAESRALDQLNRKFSSRIPRLIVEVLSPSDQTTKINRRIGQYLKRGVPLVWLVDSDNRSVTVYRPGQHHQVLDETDELTGDDVLPEFRCRVAEFFALPGTAPTETTS